MRYSYISPRQKSAFTKDMQLLFTFFSVTIFMLLLTYMFLLFRDYRFDQNRSEIVQERRSLNVDIEI